MQRRIGDFLPTKCKKLLLDVVAWEEDCNRKDLTPEEQIMLQLHVVSLRKKLQFLLEIPTNDELDGVQPVVFSTICICGACHAGQILTPQDAKDVGIDYDRFCSNCGTKVDWSEGDWSDVLEESSENNAIQGRE